MIRTESINSNSDSLLEVYVQFTKPQQYPANKDYTYYFFHAQRVKGQNVPAPGSCTTRSYRNSGSRAPNLSDCETIAS